MKRFLVQNFGCRASQADGAAIEASLRASGLVATEAADTPDLVVVNTCTVTQGADADARRSVRALHREHPEAAILVTGCYAQRAPDELAQLPGVRWVVGNSHKTNIAQIASEPDHDTEYHGSVRVGEIGSLREFLATPVEDTRSDRTRPNLKVQDGCSNKCSFCIIPAVRGRSRSAPAADVVNQVRRLAERYCEVVLSGINLGRWGRDLDSPVRFVDLLRRVLTETELRRLRISSVEPMDWSAELLEMIAGECRIAQHVHIPLQSGSDAVLKRMFRKYRTRHYASRLSLTSQLMPDAAIGADVMTGFPGETDAEFEQTVRFIEEQPFTYLHVFTYSERSGTAAATLPNAVPVPVRRERTRVLRALSERKNLEFRQRMIGKTLSAVTLEQRGLGLTSNFLRVNLEPVREPNRMIDVVVGGLSDAGLQERSLFPIVSQRL